MNDTPTLVVVRGAIGDGGSGDLSDSGGSIAESRSGITDGGGGVTDSGSGITDSRGGITDSGGGYSSNLKETIDRIRNPENNVLT